MKRTIMIVLAVAASFTMTACDALDSILQVNIFAPFAAVSASQITDATPTELLELSGSDSFYETLAEDATAKAEVLTTIDEAMAAAAPETATYQELAILGAEVVLQTTPAGELINNIADQITGFADGSTDTSDIGSLISGLLPDSVYDAGSGAITDTAAFIAMIDALDAANDYYAALGDAIGTTGYAEGSDISAGDVAQSALVAAIVASVAVPEGYSTGSYLVALINDPASVPAAGEFVLPSFDTGYLANLLLAANLDLSGMAP